MAKTYDELLASGTHGEIVAVIAANTKRLDAIYAKADTSDDEITEAKRLDSETDALIVKRDALKAFADAKAKNTKRLGEMNVVEQPTGHPETKGIDFNKMSFAFAPTVKHFKGATNAEAAEKAYRFGKFIQGFVDKSNPEINQAAKKWCDDHEIKVSQELTPQDGGVLVPIEFERTLIDLREEYGVCRPNFKNEPMSSETKVISRRTGGLTVYFVGEASAATASTKAWDSVTLVAKKLMALTLYTTEIAEDAFISVADDLAKEIAYGFTLKEDSCGFIGDGTSTYGGMTGIIPKMLGLSGTIGNIAGIRVQATISTGTFNSAILGDFEGTIARLPKYADTPKAKWYMHKTFYHSVPATLMVAAGGNNVTDLQNGARKPMLLGYPVEFTQVMPWVWVANQIFALFGDLSLAASFGDRRQTTLFSDPYSQSTSAQVQLIGSERFDAVVHDVGNASGTASLRVPGPVVAFASAAS